MNIYIVWGLITAIAVAALFFWVGRKTLLVMEGAWGLEPGDLGGDMGSRGLKEKQPAYWHRSKREDIKDALFLLLILAVLFVRSIFKKEINLTDNEKLKKSLADSVGGSYGICDKCWTRYEWDLIALVGEEKVMGWNGWIRVCPHCHSPSLVGKVAQVDFLVEPIQ